MLLAMLIVLSNKLNAKQNKTSLKVRLCKNLKKKLIPNLTLTEENFKLIPTKGRHEFSRYILEGDCKHYIGLDPNTGILYPLKFTTDKTYLG